MAAQIDILDDIAARFRDAFADRNHDEATVSPHTVAGGKALDDIVRDIIDATRHDWAGERPYIAATGEATLARMSRRDAEIRRLRHKLNRPVNVIARQFGLSPGRVTQICSQGRPRATAAPV